MIDIILKSFYLVLPAYFANIMPVIFNRLGLFRSLARPVDGGRKIGRDFIQHLPFVSAKKSNTSQEDAGFIFGQNKTWRGFVAGAVGGLIISFIQNLLMTNSFFASISVVDYQKDFLVFGILAGFGAIFGDLIKSFFKRRLNIKSGRPWPIFDQLDFIAGFFIFTYFIVRPSLEIIITVCLLTLILNPLTNLTAYFLGMKKVWW